jgi:tetratricopeptide (TPR) repeat protein
MFRIAILLLAAAIFATAQEVEVRRHDQEGVRLAQSGQLPAAIAQFRAALHLDPSYVEAWYHLGLAYNQARNTDDAMAAFEEALRIHSDYLEARYMLADCCRKRGDFTGELSLLADVVKRAPKFAEAHYNYGLALKNQEKVQQAVEELRTAVRLNSSHPKYLLALGIALADVDKKEAIGVLRDALKRGADSADGHYNLGLALATNGEETAGAEEFHRALKLDPSHAPALRALGVTLMHEGKFEESAAALRRALEVAPNDVEAANNLGAVQLRLTDIPGAIKTLEGAVQLNPSLIKAHASLAQAYQRAGRSADARREGERLAALTTEQRNRGRAMVLVESAKQQANAGQITEAIATLHKAIETSPNFADAHFQLGRLIRDSGGNPSDAIASFRHALRLDPERAEAHYEIGVILERNGRKADALTEYRIAVEMAPCHIQAKEALGRAALEARQWSTASAQFRGVLALQPRNTAAKSGFDRAVSSEGKP